MSDVEYYGDDPRGQNFWDDLADEMEREFGDGPMRVEQGDPKHNPAFNEAEEVYGAEGYEEYTEAELNCRGCMGPCGVCREPPDDGDGVSVNCPACGYELDMFGVCRNETCFASPDVHPDAPGLYDDELGPNSYDWRK